MRKRWSLLPLFLLMFFLKLAVAQNAVPEEGKSDDAAKPEEEQDAGVETDAAPVEEIPVFDLTDVGAGEAPEPDESEQEQTMSAAQEAASEPEPVEQTRHPRRFGLGISLLGEHSLGAVARLRFNHVAIDLAYGVQPVFLTFQREGSESIEWKFDMALVHADGGIAVFFSDDQKKFQNGLRAQGIFDNIMGPGTGVGWLGDLCWKRFILGFGAGVQVYFKYVDWVKDHLDLGQNIDISRISMVQLYFGLRLMWYVV